jgi:hypothetical protein
LSCEMNMKQPSRELWWLHFITVGR